jgi:hypothetical protein
LAIPRAKWFRALVNKFKEEYRQRRNRGPSTE